MQLLPRVSDGHACASRLVLALALATSARLATAREVHFLLDGTLGVAVPVADASYRDGFWPAPVVGVRIGAEIWLRHRIAIAPELELEGGPLINRPTNDFTTGRLRFLPGLRVLFGFGRGHAFFLRALVGGETLVFGPGARGALGHFDVGFAAEPGVGMQFRVARRCVVGFTAGFPIGLHYYGAPSISLNSDFEMTGFVGLRL